MSLKTYKVQQQHNISLEDYYDFIHNIPMKFNDENNRTLQIANNLVTIDGEFLTEDFELVNESN